MTIAIMLTILVAPYAVLTAVRSVWPRCETTPGFRGRVGLAGVFLFTGIGHFVRTAPMVEMLPSSVPYRAPIVYSTGILELAAVVGLLVPYPKVVRLSGICLVVFLIVVFPVNIYSAFSGSGLGSHGIGPWYLLIRGPLQLLLIWWGYRFAVRPPNTG